MKTMKLMDMKADYIIEANNYILDRIPLLDEEQAKLFAGRFYWLQEQFNDDVINLDEMCTKVGELRNMIAMAL